MAFVPPRVSITVPDGPLRALIEAIRTPSTAEHALAVELWGYDPTDAPASRVVVDMVHMGARQLQVELDAESYHLDAQVDDPERNVVVAWMTANLIAKIASEESQAT